MGLGADHIINYNEVTDWADAVKSVTPGNKGVDLIVDVVGGNTMTQVGTLALLSWLFPENMRRHGWTDAYHGLGTESCEVRWTGGNRGLYRWPRGTTTFDY